MLTTRLMRFTTCVNVQKLSTILFIRKHAYLVKARGFSDWVGSTSYLPITLPVRNASELQYYPHYRTGFYQATLLKWTSPRKTTTFRFLSSVGKTRTDERLSNVSTYSMIMDVSKYLWPKDDIGTRIRILSAVLLLIGSKVGPEERKAVMSP